MSWATWRERKRTQEPPPSAEELDALFGEDELGDLAQSFREADLAHRIETEQEQIGRDPDLTWLTKFGAACTEAGVVYRNEPFLDEDGDVVEVTWLNLYPGSERNVRIKSCVPELLELSKWLNPQAAAHLAAAIAHGAPVEVPGLDVYDDASDL